MCRWVAPVPESPALVSAPIGTLTATTRARGQRRRVSQRPRARIGAIRLDTLIILRLRDSGRYPNAIEAAIPVDARITALSKDLASLAAPSDLGGVRAALLQFEGIWRELDQAECAPVLALVLDDLVVDAETGLAKLRFGGTPCDRTCALS